MRTIPDTVRTDTRRLRDTIIRMGRLRSLRDPIFETCKRIDLTPPQFHALMWLGNDGDLGMRELAARLGISDKTMTGLVDRLERSGRVQRVRDEADRRVIRVRLTRRGQVLYRNLDTEIDRKLQSLLSVLDPDDRAALLEIFEKLAERLAQLGERAEPRQLAEL